MAFENGKSGCGCCGCGSGCLGLLAVLAIVATIFAAVRWSAIYESASSSAMTLPPSGVVTDHYHQVRQRLDRFLSGAERSISLTQAELNTLLATAPELGILRGQLVALLRPETIDIYVNLPMEMPFLKRKYLNYAVSLRPIIRGEQVELELIRVEHDGRPVLRKDFGALEYGLIQPLSFAFSAFNRLSPQTAVREIRIDSGSIVLAR
jgi:hypothetical protein